MNESGPGVPGKDIRGVLRVVRHGSMTLQVPLHKRVTDIENQLMEFHTWRQQASGQIKQTQTQLESVTTEVSELKEHHAVTYQVLTQKITDIAGQAQRRKWDFFLGLFIAICALELVQIIHSSV